MGRSEEGGISCKSWTDTHTRIPHILPQNYSAKSEEPSLFFSDFFSAFFFFFLPSFFSPKKGKKLGSNVPHTPTRTPSNKTCGNDSTTCKSKQKSDTMYCCVVSQRFVSLCPHRRCSCSLKLRARARANRGLMTGACAFARPGAFLARQASRDEVGRLLLWLPCRRSCACAAL